MLTQSEFVARTLLTCLGALNLMEVTTHISLKLYPTEVLNPEARNVFSGHENRFATF